MHAYYIAGTVASIFYYIGNQDYNEKGWLLAIISILLSLGAGHFFQFALFGIIGVNVLFYLGLLIYNIVSQRPPGSRSGF